MMRDIESAKDVLINLLTAAGDVLRVADEVRSGVIQACAVEALNQAGLPVESLSVEAVFEALRQKVIDDGGFDPGNLLDRASVRQHLRAEAIRRVAEQLGIEATTLDQVTEGIVRGVAEAIEAELEGGGAEIMDNVKVGARLVSEMARAATIKIDWQAPRVFTDKAEANRQRQAKYRANHSRRWYTAGSGETSTLGWLTTRKGVKVHK